MDVKTKLMELQDLSYRDFHAKLIPNIEKEKIIGIRTPDLRNFAKDLSKTNDGIDFLNTLPHFYYEENNLHAFLIERIKDYDTALLKCKEFLPYIDNWATCDSFKPVAFKKNKDKLINEIMLWLKSDKTYTIRYAIGLLMSLYLDDDFNEEYFLTVSEIRSDEYYVNMMIAWYFATALAKQWKVILPYIENRRLSEWAHRKTIQKAIESNRITDEQKQYLRTLR